MSIADKALWIMERNSDRPLRLGDIAGRCGVSRSHLANAFGSATRQSAMQYLRARRLSRAALALADGAPDILAVALDAGYSSHEAFTRAFRDHFATTPESVRDRRSIAGLTLTRPLELKQAGTSGLKPPRFERLGVVRVVGMRERYSFATTIGIPGQWQRFMPFYDAIPHKADEIPVGVNEPADDEGQFAYWSGVEVARFDGMPRELDRMEIAPRRYAVFEHNGHVSTLYDTYDAIWNDVLPRLGCTAAEAPGLERHNPTFDPRSGEGGLTLWIPLAD